jgi:glycerol kinase
MCGRAPPLSAEKSDVSSAKNILAIDQGTTSTRSLVFDGQGRLLACVQREFPQYYPQAGWVEHDLEDIWRDTLATAREAIERAGVPIAAIGIANQRETVALWDRATGAPVHRAIVWQDRRTAGDCERLRADGAEDLVRARTGLVLDPYFSATKLAWILANVQDARLRAERGTLAFGTIDSFLLWRLTGGRVHATDATNASRTLLFDIERQTWDSELLALFDIPEAVLPTVHDNSFFFGTTTRDLLGTEVPITGLAGDQQAALVGQACLSPGMVKATYGTGCFVLVNTGKDCLRPPSGLLTTIAYRLDGVPTYATEGAIFVAGAAVKWLRDGLRVITCAAETADLAARLDDNHGVYMVPAFVGLGAPHWDPHARGLICGLTSDSSAAHIARAALESVAYQTLDLLQAAQWDSAGSSGVLRIDGGMAGNDWFCQFLADILEVPVERPVLVETTAQGAAYLAGLGVGLYSGLSAISSAWTKGAAFTPRMEPLCRARAIEGWRDAVFRTLARKD